MKYIYTTGYSSLEKSLTPQVTAFPILCTKNV